LIKKDIGIYARHCQKGLDSRAQVSIVAPPSSNVPRTIDGTKEAITSKSNVPSSRQSVFDRKSVDGWEAGRSDGNLSPLGDVFFEIYFVRLIGTPNQP
jgi:hypothetical protein